jgi:hypothetical protein
MRVLPLLLLGLQVATYVVNGVTLSTHGGRRVHSLI